MNGRACGGGAGAPGPVAPPRRVRRRAVVAALAVLGTISAVTAVVVFVAPSHDERDLVRFVPAERTVPRYRGPASSVLGATLSLPPAPPSSGVAVRPASPPARPTCRNSTDPACGPPYWDPQPPHNTRIERIAIVPARPVHGDRVAIEVTWSDPDAPDGSVRVPCARVYERYVAGAWAPTGEHPCTYVLAACDPEVSGPWTPPPPSGAGARTVVIQLGEYAAGRYEATVEVYTSSEPTLDWPCGLPDPYGGEVVETITFEVAPPPSWTTTSAPPTTSPPTTVPPTTVPPTTAPPTTTAAPASPG